MWSSNPCAPASVINGSDQREKGIQEKNLQKQTVLVMRLLGRKKKKTKKMQFQEQLIH